MTVEGFKYNKDKEILTPADERPGKWHYAFKEWKAARGIVEE